MSVCVYKAHKAVDACRHDWIVYSVASGLLRFNSCWLVWVCTPTCAHTDVLTSCTDVVDSRLNIACYAVEEIGVNSNATTREQWREQSKQGYKIQHKNVKHNKHQSPQSKLTSMNSNRKQREEDAAARFKSQQQARDRLLCSVTTKICSPCSSSIKQHQHK